MTVRCHALILLPTFKAELVNANTDSKTKDAFSLVIGWPSNCSLCAMYIVLYMYNVCVYIVQCVWDQNGSNLGACNWPSFKINCPKINNSCTRNFHRDYIGKIQKNVRGRNAHRYTSVSICIHLYPSVSIGMTRLLISLYSVPVQTLSRDSAPCVLKFSGQKSVYGMGVPRTVLSAHNDNSLMVKAMACLENKSCSCPHRKTSTALLG